MVSAAHASFEVKDRSYFAIIKKEIHAIAATGNFTSHRLGEIDIIVAEIVSNLIKHAGSGWLLVKLICEDDIGGIELISVDNGPGMTDITRMVADGVSTKNTLGHGLGAMKRLSDLFQVYSQKDWGTVILCRVFEQELPRFTKPPKFKIKTLIIPKPGEEACGDAFAFKINDDSLQLFLGDGLGHGPEAAKAVSTALQSFENIEEKNPMELIRGINKEVKKTRGLVGTAATFNFDKKNWLLCGVGNIMTKIYSPAATKSYMAYNGIIGLNIPNTMNPQEVMYERGQYIILCSDGMKSRWDANQYIAIMRYDLSIVCAALFKDFSRHTDDFSIAVCKINL